ncbi:hypothetical protein [Gracilibacillus sp. YIM 98692]|uniref:hypothetical protein n=1 Tax=Gracilibacillus sp. YIM 98692 TaxID=2663532 RepID=UPI0013D2EFF7|nr:hypothetical protein [Gracilibacillus sp. YIM 98692]
MEATINLKYGSYPVKVQFAKYTDNGRTALAFIEGEDGSHFTGSVNIEHAPVQNNDYLVVKDYAENEGMADELKRLGLIEDQPVDYAPSGFISAPIYKLTDKAIQIRDEHFAELGV